MWKLWLFWLGRCMCTVTHLEWIHGAAAAGNQTSSFLRRVRHLEHDLLQWTEKVKRAAGCDDPESHSFATGSSACMLLISLIRGARQGWCQLQCLERPPHEAHVLPTPSDYLCISSSRSACFAFTSSLSPPFQQQFSKMAVTSFLWSQLLDPHW